MDKVWVVCCCSRCSGHNLIVYAFRLERLSPWPTSRGNRSFLLELARRTLIYGSFLYRVWSKLSWSRFLPLTTSSPSFLVAILSCSLMRGVGTNKLSVCGLIGLASFSYMSTCLVLGDRSSLGGSWALSAADKHCRQLKRGSSRSCLIWHCKRFHPTCRGAQARGVLDAHSCVCWAGLGAGA